MSNHLSLSERVMIERGLLLENSFKMIDRMIGRSPTTVSREVEMDEMFFPVSYKGNHVKANMSNDPHDHRPEICGEHHLQHINSMHRHLRRFFRGYCGVSTKYLPHYVSLYVWLKNANTKKMKGLNKISVSRVSYSDCYISRRSLETMPAVPVCA